MPFVTPRNNTMTANAEPKQRRRGPGKPFQPGVSGNPAGKRKGTRHQITLLAEQLMSEDVEGIVAKVVNAAKAGDMAAARLILDRVLPPRRGRPVRIALPGVESPQGVTNALAAIVGAMADGVLSPEEADAFTSVIERQRQALETLDLHVRLCAIEEQLTNAQH
jgi:hypothetical protein